MRFPKKAPPRAWIPASFCALVLILSALRTFNSYELISYDLRFRLRPAQGSSSDIVVIEISDDTLQNLGVWPLPRDFHASLVGVLSESGARLVVFDILFSEPTLYDQAFAESIKNSGKVYLPVAFYIASGAKVKDFVIEGDSLLADLPGTIKEGIAGSGHINVFLDSDGKTRRVPLFIRYKDTIFEQLGLKAACAWLGLDTGNVRMKGRRLLIDNDLSLPLLHDGSFAVNYPQKWERSFTHLSYFDILKSYSDLKRGIRPRLDLGMLKGKVCLVGLTATGTSDLRSTPLENVYPMLGLQASVFNSIVSRKFIIDAGVLLNTLINLFVFGLSLIICLRLTPLKAFIGNLLLGLAYFSISTNLFIYYGFWTDLFLPLLIIVATYIGSTAYRFLAETRKRQLLEKELDIARQIQENFLPKETAGFSGFLASSFMQPAKFVAGDFYDLVSLDDTRLGVFIGDVSGKGVSASLIMAQTISLFRVFSRQEPQPQKVLGLLNNELFGRFSGRFVTALFMIIDIKERKAHVSSAAQAPLLLYRRKENRVEDMELSAELPLGIMAEAEYRRIEFDIEKGDRIVACTDGMYEARSDAGKEFGVDNIKKVISENAQKSPQEILDSLKNAVSEFSFGCPQHDDITLIALSLAE
jgi:serine phosphatase RsbU (regulator of sigma subunit)